ncbi:MAG TPA: Ig-like domain-containing protein, partial [Hyphomicrobiales bacterium]|nr:Ig-like domain-containing protein [Hyphomicrobiales bacterium]
MTPGTRRILIYGGTAAVIVLAAGLGVVADLSLRGDRTVREVAVPAEIAKPPAPPSAAPPAAGSAAAAAPGAAAPSAAAMAKAPAKPAGPSFDVVRVEPSGENVVAGRAAPDSKVDLLANGKVAGTATADEAGQFVMTPPPLTPGSHQLTLRATDAAGHAALSERSVVVSVPSKPGDQLLVVAEEPGKPAEILNAGKPAAPGRIVAPAPVAAKAGTEVAALSPPAAAAGPAGAPHVDAVETDAGRLFVQGTGAPGARLGIYLNGTHLADAVVGQDGHWSLTVKHGLATGDYEVRVDQLGPGGKVVARAAVPFDYHPAAG